MLAPCRCNRLSPASVFSPRMRLYKLLPIPLFLVGAAITLAVDVVEDRFHEFDKNHDGVLSGDELQGADFLPRLDLNHDGKVTLEEAREAVSMLRNAAKRLKSKSGAGSLDKDGAAVVATDVVFKRLDTNGDGRLSHDELKDNNWFDKLNLDKDGFVTLAEAQKVIGNTISQRVLKEGIPPDSLVTEKDADTIKEKPLPLKATEVGIGRRVPDLKLTAADGGDLTLASLKGSKAVVLALFSATCPISNKLAPELARIEKDYGDKNVAVLLINTAATGEAAEARAFATDHHLKAKLIADPDRAIQKALSATTSTEVFVLDAARTLVYRGALNDQYGLGYSKEAATKHYLREALDAVLQGNSPELAATTAPGCALDGADATPVARSTGLTYHRDISRILQANCVACHHQGGLAPFGLETYAEVIEHAGMIKKQVDRGAMPPWFAAKQEGRTHEWANDRSLTDRDKTELLAWLNSERTEGDAADAPLPRRFDEQWMLGKPDAVFQIPRAVSVKAEGTMPYQTQTVETSFPEDRWVSAYEVLPTARSVVHHVIVRVHSKGSKIVDREEGRDGFFAAYVPGNSFRVLPDGFAKRLPAGAKLSFQIHYTPNGKATEDQIRIGLHFAKQAPRYEVHVASVSNPRLNIPAGAAQHVETARQAVPVNMMLTAFVAHMHVRGKSFKYELTTPDGKTETLLDIPHYDFNWQLQYDLAQPKFVPAGSTVTITAVYDNSAANPANPDPSKNVRWGQQTTDEMMIGYVEHFTPVVGAKVAAQ